MKFATRRKKGKKCISAMRHLWSSPEASSILFADAKEAVGARKQPHRNKGGLAAEADRLAGANRAESRANIGHHLEGARARRDRARPRMGVASIGLNAEAWPTKQHRSPPTLNTV